MEHMLRPMKRHRTFPRFAFVLLVVAQLAAGSVARAARDEPVLPTGGEDFKKPWRVTYREPEYPKKARKQSLQAKLIYQGVVQTSGVFDSFTLLACQVSKTDQKPDDALREYCPMFAAAAEKALGQWRYEPALKDGKPVAVYYTVSVDFKLR